MNATGSAATRSHDTRALISRRVPRGALSRRAGIAAPGCAIPTPAGSTNHSPPRSSTTDPQSPLPPEFARAERFDGVFFVDLRSAEQRQAIWRIYLDLFGLDARQKLPPDDQWSAPRS